jgi:hypothetical protein
MTERATMNDISTTTTETLPPPSSICPNCYATFRASRPRPAFCWCWHNSSVARQRRDGSWLTLANVTEDELQALSSGVVKT